MSDVNELVSRWRAELTADARFSADDIDELEGHLRDLIRELSSALSLEESFLVARHRVGDPKSLRQEYRKTRPGSLVRSRLMTLSISLALIGVIAGYMEWMAHELAQEERSRAYLYTYLHGLAASDEVSRQESQRILEDVVVNPRIDMPLIAQNVSGEIVAWKGRGLPDPSDRSASTLAEVQAAAIRLSEVHKRIRVETIRSRSETAVYLYYGSPDLLGALPFGQFRGFVVLSLLVTACVTAWRICIRADSQPVHA